MDSDQVSELTAKYSILDPLKDPEIRSAEMDQEERRIVLMGKTGVGKSATGNTILGRNAFRSEADFNSVTKHSEHAKAVVGGKLTHVVDTPGFFDTEMEENNLAMQLARSVHLSQAVVHAFLFVVECGRFTRQEAEIIEKIQQVFGTRVTDHMILLFTHSDKMRNKDLTKNNNPHLRNVLDTYKMRYHFINNKEPQNRQQVTELLQNIDSMVQQNEEKCYTNSIYDKAKELVWELFWKTTEALFCFAASVLVTKLKKIYFTAQGLFSVSVQEDGLWTAGVNAEVKASCLMTEHWKKNF